LSPYETVGDEKQQNRCFTFLSPLHKLWIILLTLQLLFDFPFSFPLEMSVTSTEDKFGLESKSTNLFLLYITSNKVRKSPSNLLSSPWIGMVNFLLRIEFMSEISPLIIVELFDFIILLILMYFSLS